MTDRAVLFSIKPKYCELIASGKKTVEVRKTRPKIPTPFKGYIYCTKPSKKHQTVSGCMVLNDDELFKLPNGKIKYGDSVEMMLYENYTADNFLNGKVIGEFVCDKIITVDCDSVAPFDKESGKYIDKEICLDRDMLWKYTDGSCAYGLHISDLKIYDTPKELSEFGLKRAPQSWCYVEDKQ